MIYTPQKGALGGRAGKDEPKSGKNYRLGRYWSWGGGGREPLSPTPPSELGLYKWGKTGRRRRFQRSSSDRGEKDLNRGAMKSTGKIQTGGTNEGDSGLGGYGKFRMRWSKADHLRGGGGGGSTRTGMSYFG